MYMDVVSNLLVLTLSLLGIFSALVGIYSTIKANRFAKTKFDQLQKKLQLPSLANMDSTYKCWRLYDYSADLLTKRSVKKQLQDPSSPYHHLSDAEIKEVGSFLRTLFLSVVVFVASYLLLKLFT